MRFYQQASDNIAFVVQRCYFEADQSRVQLALDRLAELKTQFPGNAKILYAEGIIRRDHLGQGLLARGLFECAYERALQVGLPGDYCWSAASNAAMLARTEQEYRKWAGLTATAPPRGIGARPAFGPTLERLDSGTPYLRVLLESAEAMEAAHHSGSSAASMEVALAVGDMQPTEEVQTRRHRAQRIRSLDARTEEIRTAACEWFPSEERAALQEALGELDRALALDSYDAELWNLKAAWQNLFEKSVEALEAADKAAELRNPYPKAHINAALALYRLREYDEVKRRINLALQQARELRDQSDIEQAQRLTQVYSRPPVDSTLEDLIPNLETVLRAARRCSDLEMELVHGDVRIVDIVTRLIDHANLVCGQTGIGYVPMIAEMLSDFTPETMCNGIINAKQRTPHLMDDWLSASLYLAANCGGVERRDACRLVWLLLFIPLDARRIYRNCRDLVLAPSAVPGGPLASLASGMREELQRLDPNLPPLLADQSPISDAERAQAQREILNRLSGPLPASNPNFSSERTGKPGFLSWLFGRTRPD